MPISIDFADRFIDRVINDPRGLATVLRILRDIDLSGHGAVYAAASHALPDNLYMSTCRRSFDDACRERDIDQVLETLEGGPLDPKLEPTVHHEAVEALAAFTAPVFDDDLGRRRSLCRALLLQYALHRRIAALVYRFERAAAAQQPEAAVVLRKTRVSAELQMRWSQHCAWTLLGRDPKQFYRLRDYMIEREALAFPEVARAAAGAVMGSGMPRTAWLEWWLMERGELAVDDEPLPVEDPEGRLAALQV